MVRTHNRFSDSFFAQHKSQVIQRKVKKAKIVYAYCPSILRPLDYASQGISIPLLSLFLDINAEINNSPNASPQYAASLESSASDTTENVDEHFTFSKTPHLLDQSNLITWSKI